MTGPGTFQVFDADVVPALSKVDVAHRVVKRWILDGTLKPGAPIDPHVIADRISLSTTPVREALRWLEFEGFVVLVARHTARVRELDPTELDHILDLRLQLEPVAAGLAAGNADSSARQRSVELAQAIGPSALEQQHINRQFHHCIYAQCGNEIMAQSLDAVYDHCDRYSLALLEEPSDYVHAVSQDHVLLAAAYVDGDSERLEALMREHLGNSRSLLCSKAMGLAQDDRYGGWGAWIVEEGSRA